MGLRMIKDSGAVQDTTGFGVTRTEVEPVDTSRGNGAGAHGTGFQRHV